MKARPMEVDRAYALVEATQARYFAQHKRYIEDLDEARLARAAARDNGHPLPDLPQAPLAMALQATVGVGKSHSVTTVAVACADAGLPLVVLVPTHALADEYIDRFAAAGVTACHYYGRRAPGTNGESDAWTCWKKDAVEEAGNKNHRPAQSICRTCPHGLRVAAACGGDGAVKAIKWFTEHGKEPAEFEKCRFLYEALPTMLAEQIVVMPVQSFSETAATWKECDAVSGAVTRETQRLVIVDERIELAQQITIRAGDVAGWRDALPRVQEQATKQIEFLVRFAPGARSENEQKELEQAQALLALLPELDTMFGDVAAAIAQDKQPDSARITALYDRARKAGAVTAGSARWERISYVDRGEGGFYIPLRALAVLASNLHNDCLRVGKNHWAGYEVAPVVEWAVRRGSTVFMDATLPLPVRTIIESIGGQVIEATAPQNHRVTRISGYLYSRGQVGPGDYQRNAVARMAEIKRIAAQLTQPAAILTHKATLKYSVPHCQHPDAVIDAKADFEGKTGAGIGWFGAHDRGHNDWAGRHLALVGATLLSADAIAASYGVVRAALMQAGVVWTAWDGQTGGEGAETQGVPLPTNPQVRAWLLDTYAQSLAQGIGRNRAANHVGQPLVVQLWGGIDHPELDQALTRYGIEIHERLPNTLHRTLNDYQNRGTDMQTIDDAIAATVAAAQHTNVTPSRASVRRALESLGATATDRAILARLRAWRDEGRLEPESQGGRPEKLVRDAEKAPIPRGLTAEAWDEAFSERAGILEFDAGLSRPIAEAAAMEIVTREMGPRPQPRMSAAELIEKSHEYAEINK